MEITVERLSKKDIDSITEDYLKENGMLESLPPIDIELIADLNNIQIIPINGLKAATGVDGAINMTLDTIRVDEKCFNDYATRTRFTIAHELGHSILHRDIYLAYAESELISDELSYIEQIPQIGTDEQFYWIERQADWFAAAVLMPKHALLDSCEKFSEDWTTDYSLMQTNIQELATNFEVSPQSMVFRLQDLKVINLREE